MKEKSSCGHQSLMFSCFCRKNYSLFSVLGREVRIGVLSAATLAVATPCLGQNKADAKSKQTHTTETVELGTAEVLASRTPMAAALAARQVTIISRAELSAPGVTTVNDALKNALGVDVRQRGAMGMQTDISIDGGSFDQIAYLINGFPMGNAQSGHNAADFPISIADIDHIEILQGAATRTFGSQAFSGVINIVTRKSTHSKPHYSFGAKVGSYGTYCLEERIAHSPCTPFSYTLSHSLRNSDGAVENNDLHAHTLFGTGKLKLPRFTLHTQAGAQWNAFGASTFYTPKFPDQWEATRRFSLGFRGEIKSPIQIIPQIAWVRNIDHFQLMRNVHKYENFHSGDIITSMLTFRKRYKHFASVWGGEWRYEHILSSNLGLPMDESNYQRVHGQRNAYYTHHDHRTNYSLFFEQSLLLNHWTLSAGFTGEKNTSIKGKMHLYPGIDANFRPNKHWRFYASCNKAMRLPTFTDLYYKSPTQEGNTNLQAEENTAFRIGTDFQRKGIALRGMMYYQHDTKLIDWVMFNEKDKFHATTFNLDNYGINLSADINVEKLLSHRCFLMHIRMNYGHIHQHRRDKKPYFKASYALEYLRNKCNINLHHRIYSNLTADWNMRIQDRKGHFIDSSDGKLKPYGTYTLLNGKITWEKPKYMIYLEMNNITNKHYYDIANVKQPGRTFMVGVNIM